MAWFDAQALSAFATGPEIEELRGMVEGLPVDVELERVLDEVVAQWVESCVSRRREEALRRQDLACLRRMYKVAEEVRAGEHGAPVRWRTGPV